MSELNLGTNRGYFKLADRDFPVPASAVLVAKEDVPGFCFSRM